MSKAEIDADYTETADEVRRTIGKINELERGYFFKRNAAGKTTEVDNILFRTGLIFLKKALGQFTLAAVDPTKGKRK